MTALCRRDNAHAVTVFTYCRATGTDIPVTTAVMARAIDALLAAFLDPEQVAASRAVTGLETQLISDRTYFDIQHGGILAGCGGWSGARRSMASPSHPCR